MTFRNLSNARGFFSDYYLGSVFGRGTGRGRKRKLSDKETDIAYWRLRRLRESAEGRAEDMSACRERFLRPLLRDVFGFHLGAGTDRIHALFTSADAEQSGAPPLALLWCGEWAEELDSGSGERRPQRRLERALAERSVSYGMLGTGERLRLIRAHGDGPRDAYMQVDLAGLCEEEDADSFAVAWRLLRADTFTPDADGKLPIQTIERESREHARKVSEDLKSAVFRAAESLVGGLLEDAIEGQAITDRAALSDVELRTFRDAALLALYRILFILYAEARDTRLEEHPIYVQSYSASHLLDEVLRDPARPWPENRCSLWMRVLALFRIYDEGFPAITPWEHIPPRGGEFFSLRTPEGSLLAKSRLPDLAVARLLVDLAMTAPQRGVGRERVSFRELDIEQLGHVYEGLLEFEPRVARSTTIELRVQGRLFALSPEEALRLCREKKLGLRGDSEIVAGTALAGLLAYGDETADDTGIEIEGEDSLATADAEKGVTKGTPARLIRRLERGSFHFVPGAARKGSGSFYTPLPLVQDVIRHALKPLIENKTPAEIESLRILDPACGSAHFLVEAMRYLGRALHHAYVDVHDGKAPPQFRNTTTRGWDDDWKATDEEARAANSEARAWCKRRIAERCLFGVDMNPTAVGLARVALWIESLAGDRPLSYFEHHVRTGNSLLGTWIKRLEKPPLPTIKAGAKKSEAGLFAGAYADEQSEGLFQKPVREAIIAAARLRRLIDATTPEALRHEGIDPESVDEQRFKEEQRRKAEDLLSSGKLLFDLRSSSAFVPAIWGDMMTLSSKLLDGPGKMEEYARTRSWWTAFGAVRDRERFFHWELEFPEVMLDKVHRGFDVILGNPPWDRLKPDSKEFYGRYDILIRAYSGNDLDRRIGEIHIQTPGSERAFQEYAHRIKTMAQLLRKSGDFPYSKAKSHNANEDVSKYFIDRALRLIAEGGAVGLVVPSVIYNGDGCVGIRRFLLEGGRIERFYAFENRKKIFPIHSSYKFVSLVFRKGAPADSFDAAFMRHDLEELEQDGPRPWIVRMSREEIVELSPETSAFLECRSPVDQDIVRRMYSRGVRFSSEGFQSWGAKMFRDRNGQNIFDMSKNRDMPLCTDQHGRLHCPTGVLGSDPQQANDRLDRMRSAGFIPVFEGKSVDQFLVGTSPIRWWLSIEQAKEKYNKPPREEATLVFRETARNTDERTCIAAVLPPRSAASHKLTGVIVRNVEVDVAATVFNSLAFDYALRMRTAGINVSFTYMHPMPVPPAHVTNALPRVPTLTAWDANIEHITDRQDLWPGMWSANRAVAEAYGLSPDDFDHILSSFPGMAKKRKPFVAYLRARLAEWKQEATGVEDTSYSYPSALTEETASVAADSNTTPRTDRST